MEAFDPSELLRDQGCRGTANTIKFADAFVRQLSADIYAAYCTLKPDSNCTNGVFEYSCAIDDEPNRAKTRATFEAVERYSLAAIEFHTTKILSGYGVDAGSIVAPKISMRDPLNGARRTEKLFPVVQATNLQRPECLVPIGDVFAPYPTSSGNCSFVPTTNGAAVGRTPFEAVSRAGAELLERDAIMRFWYLSGSARRISEQDIANCAEAFTRFLRSFDYSILGFEISPIPAFSVVLLFAVHEQDDYPALLCSAGASTDFCVAVRSASSELIQTLSALALQVQRFESWVLAGKSITHLDHHMYYYADPKNGSRMAELLRAKAARLPYRVESPTSVPILDLLTAAGIPLFVADITPPLLAHELTAVRAVSADLYPLVVGEEAGPFELIRSTERISSPHPFP